MSRLLKITGRHHASEAGGFALVTVLVAIVMASLLIVGLIMMAESELKTTSRYFDSLDAQLAAESAVELVKGQIAQATSEGIDSNGKGTMTWASQPGALRTYDDEGKLSRVYKLYSNAEMVTTDAEAMVDGEDVPGTWAAQPDQYVDLNEPVKRYGQWIYPIVSPEALSGSNAVVGFTVSGSSSGTNAWDDSLAMPVRWLYVMEDGSLKANLTPADDPVLRVAFWTDDEASKININTASATNQDSYADIPRANYADERNKIAFMQPSQNEFNRYPGHPATVSLTPVFSGSNPLKADIQKIIEASPRYRWGGSENASISVKPTETRTSLDAAKPERLYVAPDEYLYRETLSDGVRQGQLNLNATVLDTRRFFLTAASRSADLNLFGQPRVTIWPISAVDDDQHRTPYDKLIARCATLGVPGTPGSKAYYFVRSAPWSQQTDWSYARNQEIDAYLRALTAREIPGFGGNFLEKYDVDEGGVTGERDQILTEIFDYIRCANLNEPYKQQSGNFSTYTTSTRDSAGSPWTLTNGGTDIKPYTGAGFVMPIKIPAGGGRTKATRGAGRSPVISEVGLWLIQMKGRAVTTGSSTKMDWTLDPDPPEVQPGLIVETFSPMQGFMPWISRGFSIKVRNIGSGPRIVDAGGSARQIVPDTTSPSIISTAGLSLSQGQSIGGIDGFVWHLGTNGATDYMNNGLLSRKAVMTPINGDVIAAGGYKAIPLPPGGVQVLGGDLEISLCCDDLSPNEYQTYVVRFPDATLPIPQVVEAVNGNASQLYMNRQGWPYRRSGGGGGSGSVDDDGTDVKFMRQDVVRGVMIGDGDFRTIAYLENVPRQFFDSPNWNSPDLQLHGFRGGINDAYLGTQNGSYVPGNYFAEEVAPEAKKFASGRPKIVPTITSLRAKGWEGDFDNGVAHLVDGPYLNKPDEGGYGYNSSVPYFAFQWKLGEGLFSPLRQMPSAVVFGSLPTSVLRNAEAYGSDSPGDARPWRTLNFCPNPLAKSAHYGLVKPADHLLLDLFHMPVVEPYAISEPFSTAGRINMNYKIAPFSNIKRQTALHAALASQKIIAINSSFAVDYKTHSSTLGKTDKKIRFEVNAKETLKQFDRRFDSDKDLFRSASEICDLFLVPDLSGVTADNVEGWWDNYQLTGNNSRERPYATLYPLLTTKSNVFTTHVRAQSIKRLANGSFAVKSEYRGAVTFERYLDPNDPAFAAAGGADPDQVSLEHYYGFRTLLSKRFAP